jgi:hypothetical protein
MISKTDYSWVKIKFLVFFILALCLNNVYAQNLLDDASGDITYGSEENLFTETINIISRSGKIFILSNSNQLLNKGDFITLLLKDGGPLARAVVAKNHNESAGIKVLKVYSLKRWSLIRKGLNVQIKKGDDSFLFRPKKNVAKEVPAEKRIESEEDLFNDKSLVEEDLTGFYKDNRLIKPDSIVTGGWSRFTFANDITGDTQAENQFSFAWAYQFSDNYWIEALYGRTKIDGFPASGAQTLINNFTVKLKYTFKAPFYSYIMPYIGFQTYSVSSPNAGVVQGDQTADRNLAQAETDMINKLQTSQIAVGITILKRMVPGWFLKADLGNDIINLGFGIEF